MRRGQPWYKRDPIAALDGYQGLGPELIGAYNTLLDLIYARDGETLRDDRHLAGVMGCSKRKAKALTDQLLEKGKLHFHDGFVTNSRAKKSVKRPRNDHEKEPELNENNNLTDGSCTTKPSLDKDKDKDKELASQICSEGKEPVSAEFVGALVEALGPGHDHLIASAMSQLGEWLGAGYQRKDILGAVRDVVSRHNYPTADKLGYFTEAIGEAAAKRKAGEPLALDEITPDQWRTAIRYYRKTKQWSAPGGPPGFNGCLVPPDICAEFTEPLHTHTALGEELCRDLEKSLLRLKQ